MGVSASSLLDEVKSNYIKGQAQAELQEFSPYYRKQFSVARFSQVEDDLDQEQKTTQLLRQREAPEAAEVLYEEVVYYFDDTRKWKERHVVVRANYSLECHDCLESFLKGFDPRHKLLPTGGSVLTTEESYMAMVDKCFPDDGGVKEDFVPPLSGMPGQFPVYLRLPYRRDSYFCFTQQAKQAAFMSILSDCIRHQNQDYLKKRSCEVQAFLKAIQLYRQDRGRYHAWDMLIGSDVRVLANAMMEKLLPSLEKDMLPRLKAKKTERKRVWFATVEAAYILVQEHLLEGLSVLKEECRVSVRQQEVLIHSDMDQILKTRQKLEEQIRAAVSGPAEQLCAEAVQPHLGSILDELMAPLSSGFLEGRQLSEDTMDTLCHRVLQGEDGVELRKSASHLVYPELQNCYHLIGSLTDKLGHLQDRFGFSNVSALVHSAQIDLQQLVENAAYTFNQLQQKAVQDHPENPDHAAAAMEKGKHRVLKQYDYDSSTVRKTIVQDALVCITLPFIKERLAPSCKKELQDLEQPIDPDHEPYISVENLYEGILLQTLDKEVTKVVKEAASLKKYNLFTDSRDLLSQFSRCSFSSLPISTPGSPATPLASPVLRSPSPTGVHASSSSPQREEPPVKDDSVSQEKTSTASEGGTEVMEVEPAAPEPDVVQTVKTDPEKPDVTPPETVIQKQITSGQQEEAPTAAELETPKQKAESSSSETPSAAEDTTAEEPRTEPRTDPLQETINPSAGEPGPDPGPEPVNPSTEEARPDSEGSGTVLEPGGASADRAVPDHAPDPGSDPTPEPSPNSALEPGPDSTPESGPDPTPEPGPDSAPEPGPDSAPGPDSDPTPEPGPDFAPGPDSDPTPEPGPDFAPEPGSDPTPEPGPDSAPEPGPDSSPELADPPGEPEEKTACSVPAVQVVAASGGEAAAEVEDAEPVTFSEPNSLDVSVGSDSPPSDLESTDEVSTTSDVLEDERPLSRSPVSSDEPTEDRPASEEPSPQVQMSCESSEDARRHVEAGASLEAEVVSVIASPPKPIKNQDSPEARPPDCIRDIRDLVSEVIEVEEVMERYPDGIPKEE